MHELRWEYRQAGEGVRTGDCPGAGRGLGTEALLWWRRFAGAARRTGAHEVQKLVFFALFFLYLWLVVEPHLIFHGSDRITNFPSFYKTWDFFTSHVSRPGGLVEYVSAFLSQLFHFSWLGALVVTIQAWALGLLSACLLRTMGLRRLRIVTYAPAVLLVVIYGRYTYFLPTTMVLVCALALASGHRCLAVGRTPAKDATLFVGLSAICYYVAGAGVLLMALLCAIPELLRPGRRRLAAWYALVAGGLPYVLGVKLFGTDTVNAYSDLLPFSWKLLYFAARRRGVETVYLLYLLAPGIMAVAGIVSTRWTGDRRIEKGKAAGRKPEGKPVDWRRALPSCCVASPICRWLAHTATLVSIGGMVAYGSLDRAQKTHFAVDYYAYHRMWPRVLTEGRKGSGDPFVMHAVNRALYYSGQLGHAMFAWPQRPAYLLLPTKEYPWAYWQNAAVNLELGFLNSAENALMECLAALGDRPMILQQLARINMVKGNADTAKVYLHALSATLFHGDWAKRYLDLLEQDPDLATDEGVQGLRRVAMEQDHAWLGLPEEDMLSCLLEKDSRNRMAHEYLMVSYLLNRQLTRFVRRIEELPSLGYETLPRHYEEAILVYSATARTAIPLRGYQPRDEVRRQIEHFLGVLQSHGGDKQAAYADLAKFHGDTYAFYNVYGPRERSR